MMYRKMNFQLATSVCLAATAGLLLYVPHVKTAGVLLLVFALAQIPLGMFEAGSNMYILHLWGSQMTPFMQSLHFAFGVGALLAPVVAAPFLNEQEDGETQDADCDGTTVSATFTGNSSNISDSVSESFHPELVRLVYPYSIAAAVMLANSLFYLIVWWIYPLTSAHPSKRLQQQEQSSAANSSTTLTRCRSQASTLDDSDVDACKRQESFQMDMMEQQPADRTTSLSYKMWKVIVVMLTLIFMHIYLGLEITFGSYLMTFAVKCNLNLSKADGAHLTTLFWSTFTLFRIFTVFYIEFVGNQLNIFASLTVVLIANVLLVPFGSHNLPLLWTGVALIGIGVSSIWACVFGFLEEHFAVTSLISAFMIVSAVLGEFVFPVVISSFINCYPMILMWVTLFCSCGITIAFCLMSLICRTKLGKITSQDSAASAKTVQQ